MNYSTQTGLFRPFDGITAPCCDTLPLTNPIQVISEPMVLLANKVQQEYLITPLRRMALAGGYKLTIHV